MDEKYENYQKEPLSREDREEIDLDNLDEFLSGIEPGYTVIISRVEPSWCKGVLEDFSITETSSPISLNYLITTWGGHKLRLRFRRPNGRFIKHRDINLYTFEPLIYGQPLKNTINNPHIQTPIERPLPGHEIVPVHQQAIQPAIQPAIQNDTKMEMMELLKMLQAMRAADMQAMAAMMPQRQDYDPFKLMQGAFGLFAQFNQAIRPTPEKNDNDEVIGLLGKLADVFGQQKQSESPPSRLTPPKNDKPLHEQIAGLNPAQAFGVFQQAVATMPQERREQTLSEMITSFDQVPGFTETLLSHLEKRGMLEIDDDEVPEDVDSPDSGRESEPNEGDDTPDRPLN